MKHWHEMGSFMEISKSEIIMIKTGTAHSSPYKASEPAVGKKIITQNALNCSVADIDTDDWRKERVA